jgi:hypothetical protein
MTVRSGFDPSSFCMRVWGAQHTVSNMAGMRSLIVCSPDVLLHLVL